MKEEEARGGDFQNNSAFFAVLNEKLRFPKLNVSPFLRIKRIFQTLNKKPPDDSPLGVTSACFSL